jgi:putative DNA primase/helicase
MAEWEDDDPAETGGTETYRPGRRGSGSGAPPPNRVAELVLVKHKLVTDVTGTVYRYEMGHWIPAPDAYLAKLALDADGDLYSTQRRRSEIVSFIRARTLDPLLSWGRVGEGEVPCANGIVDVLTGRLRPHAPENYLERVIPWRYDPTATCDTWMQSLIDWFGDHDAGAECIAALQEFLGYICLQHARYKKALILKGPSNSGKSQIVHVCMQLVGPERTCQLSVEHMDDPTRRAVIVGKSLNVMTELTTDALIADGGFKTMVSTEEPLLIDEKYKPAYMYVPTAKHVIATNALPAISDRSEGTFNRLLILPMNNVIPKDRQDPTLEAKLVAEMEGILVWALEGARRLVARGGQWPTPAAMAALMAEYRADQNPVQGFLDECFLPDSEAAEPLTSIVGSFNKWQGGKRTTPRVLAAMLRQALGPDCIRKARSNGRVMRCLVGWRFQGLTRNVSFTVDARAAAAGAEELEVKGVRDGLGD